MILYIDETENDTYFVVAGLLANGENEVIDSYKSFKKRANNCNLNNKSKQIIFTEFKSTLLDKSYQRIKCIMLEELSNGDFIVPYCVYKKANERLSQKEKENVMSITPVDSLDTPGVQFADNLCSVVRLSILDCKNDFAKIMGDKFVECSYS